MKKKNRLIISLIMGSIFVVVFLIFIGKFKFTITNDILSQLKSEYNTYWADETYGKWNTGQGNPPPSPTYYNGARYNLSLFECGTTGDGQTFTSNSEIGAVGGGSNSVGSISCTSTKDFKGQELVVVFYSIRNGAIEGFNNIGSESKILLYKPHTLNPNIYDIYFDNLLIPVKKDVDFSSGLKLSYSASGDRSGGGAIGIQYIGSKSLFSCDLGSSEVWIQENFAQPFSIKDLEFTPTKFCKETRPFVLRDIQQGETAIFPDPIPLFNKGDILQVPSGKIGVVNYATYFVDGVNNKCAPNEANIKLAEKWVCSQVIKPVEIVVQCKQDSDCFIPTKPQCFGYFIGCQNNKCAYDENIPDSPVCKNEVVTTIIEYQKLIERRFIDINTPNLFTFTEDAIKSSFNIGNSIFSSDTKSDCGIPPDIDIINPPQPSIDCYYSDVIYGNKNYKVKDSQIVELMPGVKFTYFVGGELKRDNENIVNNLQGRFYFTINEWSSIDVDDTSEILKNSEKEIEIVINNNLPDGKIIIKLKQQVKMTNEFLPEQIKEIEIKKGINEIRFKINTESLGINQFTLQSFYKINADAEILLSSNQVVFNYKIVNKLSNINEPIIIYQNKTIEIIKEIPKEISKEIFVEKIITKVPPYIWWIIGILIFTIIIVSLRKQYRRKRK